MSGKTDKDVPGSDAEGPGQGGETPAARYAAARNTTALSPVQERLRRQQELSQRILEAAREEGQAEPDFQTASPAGRLHRRLREAAGTQKRNELNEPVAEEGFRSTKNEALEEEREEQRLKHQAEMDNLFDRRFNGDPDMQPVTNLVQEATALLVVGELQPEVTLAHDKAGTVSQLADCIRGQKPRHTKSVVEGSEEGW